MQQILYKLKFADSEALSTVRLTEAMGLTRQQAQEEQEDAHEFLINLLNSIQDCLIREKEQEFIDIIQTSLIAMNTCDECNQTKYVILALKSTSTLEPICFV